jgi:2'-5' RNA ligase
MQDETLRLFIAIGLDDALRDALRRAQKQLQDERAMHFVRWVAPQNIHLTLKFLGNQDRALAPALTAALQRAAVQRAPFELNVRGFGCYPNTRRPNVLWVGLEGALQATALLAQAIEDQCAALGIARDERAFSPHLTLGRVNRETPHAARAEIGTRIAKAPNESLGIIRANAVDLIASALRPSGPVYTTLAEVRLE